MQIDRLLKMSLHFLSQKPYASDIMYTPVKDTLGTDVGSDHHLVQGKVQLRLKKMQKPKTITPFAVEKLKDQQKSQQFRLALENKFESLLQATDIEEQWAIFREAVTKVVEDRLGRRRGKRKEIWI
uniref:Uncharacterized protein n=1 Tax=Octopus bimaculoides TaxID=37653 RepID=A0A0L8HT33_OCTBM